MCQELFFLSDFYQAVFHLAIRLVLKYEGRFRNEIIHAVSTGGGSKGVTIAPLHYKHLLEGDVH